MNLKRALASVLMPGEEERWLDVWERVTTSISRWAIGVVVISVIAGTTQGVTAWLLGSSYAVALGVIAGLLDMIPNIGATIAGFILVPTLWAEEGLTAAIIMLVVVLVYQQVENNILTPEDPGQGGQPLGVLHHRRRDAVRRPARRARRAHGGPARRDDPDLRAGADEGAAREGRRGEGGRGSQARHRAGRRRQALDSPADVASQTSVPTNSTQPAARGSRSGTSRDLSLMLIAAKKSAIAKRTTAEHVPVDARSDVARHLRG